MLQGKGIRLTPEQLKRSALAKLEEAAAWRTRHDGDIPIRQLIAYEANDLATAQVLATLALCDSDRGRSECIDPVEALTSAPFTVQDKELRAGATPGVVRLGTAVDSALGDRYVEWDQRVAPSAVIVGEPGATRTRLLDLLAYHALTAPEDLVLHVCDPIGDLTWVQRFECRYTATPAEIADLLSRTAMDAHDGAHSGPRIMLLINDIDPSIVDLLTPLMAPGYRVGLRVVVTTTDVQALPDELLEHSGFRVVLAGPGDAAARAAVLDTVADEPFTVADHVDGWTWQRSHGGSGVVLFDLPDPSDAVDAALTSTASYE